MKCPFRKIFGIYSLLPGKIWLLPLLLSFCWISFWAPVAYTFAEAAETSKNPDQAQQAFENIQNHIDSALAKKKPSKLLEAIIDEYSKENESAGNWSERTIIEYRSIFKNILRLIGNLQSRDIGPKMLWILSRHCW